MGIGIKKPELHYARSYQKIDGSWYPKDIYYTVKLNLIEKHLFRKNVNSMFNLQQVFSVQHINVEHPEQVTKEKLYTEKKALAEQVYPKDDVNWSIINKVQF